MIHFYVIAIHSFILFHDCTRFIFFRSVLLHGDYAVTTVDRNIGLDDLRIESRGSIKSLRIIERVRVPDEVSRCCGSLLGLPKGPSGIGLAPDGRRLSVPRRPRATLDGVFGPAAASHTGSLRAPRRRGLSHLLWLLRSNDNWIDYAEPPPTPR